MAQLFVEVARAISSEHRQWRFKFVIGTIVYSQLYRRVIVKKRPGMVHLDDLLLLKVPLFTLSLSDLLLNSSDPDGLGRSRLNLLD